MNPSRFAPGEKRLQAVFEMAPVGIVSVDLRTLKLVGPNPAMCEMLGYPAEELCRHTVDELTHPEDRDVDVNAIEARAAGLHGLISSDKRMIHKDGSTVWVRIHAVPLEFEDGQPAVILGIVLDRSERIRAERERAEARQRLDLVLHSSQIGMWDWSIQSGRLEVDEIWARMIGYEKAELALRVETFYDRLHPEDIPRTEKALNDHWNGAAEFYECQFRYRHHDGRWLWILARGRVVEWDESRKPLRMLGTHVDITELKQAEQERQELEVRMQQTQKLESLGVLAGGIAHDFNNILMVIQGHAELATFEHPKPGPLQESLDQILASVDQASDLCAQMLAYSGKGTFIIDEISLSGLVEQALPLLQSSVTRRVSLDVIQESPSEWLHGDPTQIRQIVMNLVINAAEAMEPDGGTVTITTGARDCPGGSPESDCCQGLPPGRYTYLRVSDNGSGMDEETQHRIFEPFFTTKFTGRGLGLSAVQGIVRSHEGGLCIDTEPGRGTTIEVLFPVSEPVQDESPDGVELDPGFLGEGMFLAVDDEPTVLRLAHNMLTRIGYEVLDAANGHEAVALFKRFHGEIQGVLLDLTMQGMDGEETLRELRRIDPDVKVILCSGYTENEIERRFYGRKPHGFLHKPYSLDELRSVLVHMAE